MFIRLLVTIFVVIPTSWVGGSAEQAVAANNNVNGYQAWNWNSGSRMIDDNGTMWFADVNGDGKADMISKGQPGAWNAGVVYVSLSTGSGYQPWTWYSEVRMIDDNSTMWFADVNGDGKADMISKGQPGAWNAGVVYVSLSTGRGYQPWTWYSGSRMIDDNGTMWFADVNGDGKADMISKGQPGAWNAGVVYVSLSTGSGYQPWTWYSEVRMIDDNSTMWFADVNGDGKADMISKGQPGAWNAGVVYVSLSTGSGYQPWTWYSGSRMIDDNTSIWFADVNGDGKSDLISKGQPGGANAGIVFVSLSSGSGYPSWSWNSGNRMIDDKGTMWFGDVDGDGKDDLISIGEDGAVNEGWIYVALSTGRGFQPWTWNSGRKLISNQLLWLTEINGDGKVDIVTKGTSGSSAGLVYISLSTTFTQTRYVYNSSGRLVEMVLPDGSIIHFEYDSNGNLMSKHKN
ncbi:FG-GAP repeat protein [compost metagenome]